MLRPTRGYSPARAEPRSPESNPGLGKFGSFPLHLTHHIPSFNTGEKNFPRDPGSGGCLLRERLSRGSFASPAKPPRLVGAGGDGGQEPPQDEGLQSLGG